jgi:hypothetical protein
MMMPSDFQSAVWTWVRDTGGGEPWLTMNSTPGIYPWLFNIAMKKTYVDDLWWFTH